MKNCSRIGVLVLVMVVGCSSPDSATPKKNQGRQIDWIPREVLEPGQQDVVVSKPKLSVVRFREQWGLRNGDVWNDVSDEHRTSIEQYGPEFNLWRGERIVMLIGPEVLVVHAVTEELGRFRRVKSLEKRFKMISQTDSAAAKDQFMSKEALAAVTWPNVGPKSRIVVVTLYFGFSSRSGVDVGLYNSVYVYCDVALVEQADSGIASVGECPENLRTSLAEAIRQEAEPGWKSGVEPLMHDSVPIPAAMIDACFGTDLGPPFMQLETGQGTLNGVWADSDMALLCSRERLPLAFYETLTIGDDGSPSFQHRMVADSVFLLQQ